MKSKGLDHQFPLNRPLTGQEQTHRLQQKKRLDVDPLYQLAVIKMNSTYLESVDKWFGWKGIISAIAITVLLIFTTSFGYMGVNALLTAAGFYPTEQSRSDYFIFGSGMTLVLGLIWWAMLQMIKKEAFAYTHYPIRFNRRTRTVHFFHTDGSTASVPWDDIYFTLAASGAMWGVRGHVLAEDRWTVIDTFALSHTGVIYSHELDPTTEQYSSPDFVRAHWEFVRRYMEEGPEEAARQVQFCMPVDGRRETAMGGAQRVFANFAGNSTVFLLFLFPFLAWISLVRVFAMRTSKVPVWPAEIEAACKIESDDPFIVVGDSAGDRVAPH